MAESTKIEWCDHTFNPWEGCTKVSPGCANCYAEARDQRFTGGKHWGKGAPRRRTSAANWRQPLKWDAAAARSEMTCEGYGQPYRRPRVFCASLADWLDAEVPTWWLADLLGLINDTPNLDWLLLTKRPENFTARVTAAYELARSAMDMNLRWLRGEAPDNAWIGTTVENQEMADKRIPDLLRIPARVRFLSCEPLLSAVDLSSIPALIFNKWGASENRIHWVICGGESGPNARPMHPDWARSLRDQCKAAGVPYFFKQWGEWAETDIASDTEVKNGLFRVEPGDIDFRSDGKITGKVFKVGRPNLRNDGCPASVTFQHWEERDERLGFEITMRRVGKKAAGRLLDGVEHSETPEVRRG